MSFDITTNSDGLHEKLIYVNRNAKVVKGGRIFSFSAVTVVGDGKGRLGFGMGKAREVPDAIQKALQMARRNMIYIELNGKTVWHEIIGRHGATKVFIKPASEGTGIIAGGVMRAVFEVLGVQDILEKTIGSANPGNVLRATINGLTSMMSPEQIAEKRGLSVKQVLEGSYDRTEQAS
ncbi:MAG: 30S ribosomal protein S5 [Pseudomonadota bacterium]